MQRKSFRLLTLFILLALLSSLALPAFAQDTKPTDPPPAAPEAAPPSAPLGPIGSYTFTNIAPGAYADLTGDTPFAVNGGGGSLDDGYSLDQTIPFPFNFGGSVFTVYRVNTNGWLGFGSPTATSNYSALNGTVNNVIAFVNRDFNNVGAVYSSVTEGVTPNRIHKIQAKNFYRYNTATMTGNAQIWLYETTNAIEIHFGAFAQTWTSGTTVQVGLRGGSTGTADVRSLAGTGATTWTNPTVGNSSTSTMALALTVTPDSGRVYRFDPVVAPNLGASTKTAAPAVVRTGNNIAYQLVIKNTGDAAAAGATISDPIPTGANYVAGSVATVGGPAAIYNPGSNAVEWGAAPLAIGQAVTVTFQVNVTALSGSSVVNTATYNATNVGAATQKVTTTPVVGCVNDAGYVCADSLTPGGPTYNWLDATGGTLILDAGAAVGDDREANVVLPFPFTFYATTSSDIRVGDNGAILFGATTGEIDFVNLAMSSAPANFIAPFWDDMDTDTGGTYGQVFGAAPNRVYVVEWYDRPHFSNVGSRAPSRCSSSRVRTRSPSNTRTLTLATCSTTTAPAPRSASRAPRSSTRSTRPRCPTCWPSSLRPRRLRSRSPRPSAPLQGFVPRRTSSRWPPGATVYYCYSVTNTGDITLNLHDLADSELGTIFTGLSYALTPGSSVNTVAAGLSIPAVINATTVNTATWTAYNAGPIDLVSAINTATVFVPVLPEVEAAKDVNGPAAVTLPTGIGSIGYTVAYTNPTTLGEWLSFEDIGTISTGAVACSTPVPGTVPPGGSGDQQVNCQVNIAPDLCLPTTAVLTNTVTVTATVSEQSVSGDSLPSGQQDIYSFEGGQGTSVSVLVDTVSAASAFDIEACLSTTTDQADCFAFGDDNVACTYPPPAFGCPAFNTTLPADGDGIYYLLVESGSGTGSYAGPVGLYEATVTAIPGISPLALVGNNLPGSFRAAGPKQDAPSSLPRVAGWLKSPAGTTAGVITVSAPPVTITVPPSDPGNPQCPPTAVTLTGLVAGVAQSPIPAAIPMAALPAVSGLALAAAYLLRRKR